MASFSGTFFTLVTYCCKLMSSLPFSLNWCAFTQSNTKNSLCLTRPVYIKPGPFGLGTSSTAWSWNFIFNISHEYKHITTSKDVLILLFD